MAWTTPLTAVSNAALTAAQWNASVRDNLLETAVAKASTTSSYFVGAGPNSVVERAIAEGRIDTAESTSATSSSDLATVGPAVASVTTGTRALVVVSGSLQNNTVNAATLMGYEVSGASTIPMAAVWSIRFTSSTANASATCSIVTSPNLTPGSNTFTAKYFVGSGTGTYSLRRLTVMPF